MGSQSVPWGLLGEPGPEDSDSVRRENTVIQADIVKLSYFLGLF